MTFLDRIARGIRPEGRAVGRAERIAADINARYAGPIAAWAFIRNVEDARWMVRAAFYVWLVRRGWLGMGDMGR